MKSKVLKPLQIVSSVIKVSICSLIEGGYYFGHEVKGVLPGCRKVQLLTITPMSGNVWVKALYSYNGEAHIDPSDWLGLIDKTPVVADRHMSAADLTPELAETAKKWVSSIVECSAIHDMTHVHPDTKREFNELVVSFEAFNVKGGK